jgi:hypothetical protein
MERHFMFYKNRDLYNAIIHQLNHIIMETSVSKIVRKRGSVKLGKNYSLPAELVKVHFSKTHDWDWNEPERPYLEMPEKSLYDKVLWREEARSLGISYGTSNLSLDDIKLEIKGRIRITKNEVFKIGELLVLAKPLCQQARIHFQDWINANFEFSYETANNFMNVYKQCMGVRDIAMHLPLSVLYKISKPNFPEELRDWLLAQGNLEEISIDHVDGLLNKYREGGFKFEAVEDDIKEINRRYIVFRQTHDNIKICESTLQSLLYVKGKLKYSEIELDWDDSSDMQPEASEITRNIYQTFDKCIAGLKETIKESNKILDACYKEIENIKGV